MYRCCVVRVQSDAVGTTAKTTTLERGNAKSCFTVTNLCVPLERRFKYPSAARYRVGAAAV
jgi:hypothetical protein